MRLADVQRLAARIHRDAGRFESGAAACGPTCRSTASISVTVSDQEFVTYARLPSARQRDPARHAPHRHAADDLRSMRVDDRQFVRALADHVEALAIGRDSAIVIGTGIANAVGATSARSTCRASGDQPASMSRRIRSTAVISLTPHRQDLIGRHVLDASAASRSARSR